MASKKGILLQRISNKSPRSCVVPAAMMTTDQEGYTTLTTTTVPFVNITATGNTILGNNVAVDTVTVNSVTTMNGNLNVVGSDTALGGLLEVAGDTTLSKTLTVGADDTGYDVQFFGATTGKSLLRDESADKLIVTGDASVSGLSTLTGLATLTAGIDGKVIFAGTETIAAGGTTTALALTKTCHYIDADAGGDTFTLANGVAGQIMVIVCASATGVATITPATMKWGTSVTLNAAGDTVLLAYVGAGWSIIGGNGYTVVA